LFTGQDEIQHTIFSAYPVPGDGRFNVLITASLQGTYTILVYNQLGEKVYECCDFPASGTTEKQVDLRPAAAGIYSVMLITSGHKAMRKVLVK
jgi:hypothetical protein